MNWEKICDDPSLRDLPYKMETNEWGQIVLTPINNRRGFLCGLLADALRGSNGHLMGSCPIETDKGVRVTDVAWVRPEFLTENVNHLTCSTAPPLCIDVVVAGVPFDYYAEKRELYFARGAQEVWLCDEQGNLTFFDCTGQMPASRLFPGLSRIESEYLH